MTPGLPAVLDAFPRRRILVVGEAMLDSYLEGSADRLGREAPVPIVSLRARSDAPGGAANTAVNLAALGADVRFLSVVGGDREGRTLLAGLRAHGVPVHDVLVAPERVTLSKNRVVADGQILVRFDQGTTESLPADVEDRLLGRLAELHEGCDAIVVSDYGYGIFGPRVIAALGALQRERPRLVVADAKDLRRFRGAGVTAAKPNYAEAVRLLGERAVEGLRARLQQIGSQGERLLEMCGAEIVAVTLDTDGALVFERGAAPYRTYARPAAQSRAAGAGDTFVAALALALAAGARTPEAAELASAASAIVVGKSGTATCSADELREYVAGEQKVLVERAMAARVASLRQANRRIVFTNGCFDILHRGHITYLNRAKALGDVLIVGLNSDASVARLKGPGRPINGLEDRSQVLAALSCVDYIVPFDEDTPAHLIESIRPDV